MNQQKFKHDLADSDILNLESCTVATDNLDTEVTESRIENIDELKEMGVFSFTFCVIC